MSLLSTFHNYSKGVICHYPVTKDTNEASIIFNTKSSLSKTAECFKRHIVTYKWNHTLYDFL